MLTKQNNAVSDQPGLTRFSTFAKAKPSKVDRAAEVIDGYAVITAGEALGHGAWVDGTFLDSLVEFGNSSPQGFKSRFTHPGLSSDGMGKQLGRTKNFRREGDSVKADLHFIQAAHKSPEGDLSGYVMDIAEEAPELFGSSIVFSRDSKAEREFKSNNMDPEGKFKSPDAANVNHFPHIRLAELHASDVVDDPAANPGGFFSEGGELAANAETALEYLFGLRDEIQEGFFGNIHPERARAFVQGFMERRFDRELSGVSRIETETKGVPLMDDKAMTLEVLQATYPGLCESLRKQGVEEGLKKLGEIQLAERKRATSIVKEAFGFKGFESGIVSKFGTKVAELLDSEKSAEECQIDLKTAYLEHLQEFGIPSVGASRESEGKPKYEADREGDFRHWEDRAAELQKQHPDWSFESCLKHASIEIGATPIAEEVE